MSERAFQTAGFHYRHDVLDYSADHSNQVAFRYTQAQVAAFRFAEFEDLLQKPRQAVHAVHHYAVILFLFGCVALHLFRHGRDNRQRSQPFVGDVGEKTQLVAVKPFGLFQLKFPKVQLVAPAYAGAGDTEHRVYIAASEINR